MIKVHDVVAVRVVTTEAVAVVINAKAVAVDVVFAGVRIGRRTRRVIEWKIFPVFHFRSRKIAEAD